MLTGQSNFSLVTSHFWLVKIFTKKSSTHNVSQIKPTNSLFVPVTARPFKDWLNIFLNRFNSSHSNGIPIDLECMTNSKRMVFSRSNRYMYALVYVFVRGHNKKEIKTLRFTVRDLIVYSRMNNATISTWHDWSTWPVSEVFGQSSHHSGQTLPVDRPLFWALNIHQSNRSYIYICSYCVTKNLHLWLEGTECQRM